MLYDYLERRGRLAATTIKIISPMSTPIPISPEASASILRALEERDIGWWPESKVTAPTPPRRSPPWPTGRRHPTTSSWASRCIGSRVVEESALAEDGWVPVDHTTFATRFENVYAVGDVTSAPVPRVGAIAEGEARTLAEVIAHQIRAGRRPSPTAGSRPVTSSSAARRWHASTPTSFRAPRRSGPLTLASEATAASKVEFGATPADVAGSAWRS